MDGRCWVVLLVLATVKCVIFLCIVPLLLDDPLKKGSRTLLRRLLGVYASRRATSPTAAGDGVEAKVLTEPRGRTQVTVPSPPPGMCCGDLEASLCMRAASTRWNMSVVGSASSFFRCSTLHDNTLNDGRMRMTASENASPSLHSAWQLPRCQCLDTVLQSGASCKLTGAVPKTCRQKGMPGHRHSDRTSASKQPVLGLACRSRRTRNIL